MAATRLTDFVVLGRWNHLNENNALQALAFLVASDVLFSDVHSTEKKISPLVSPM